MGILGSVASLLSATLYQGNPDRKHKGHYYGTIKVGHLKFNIKILVACCKLNFK